MTAVVNFFAGPGAGKSTLSTKLFGLMKELRYNVEFVPEFAKELTWKESFNDLSDQIYVFGEQHHRIYSLIDKVDYIITDSPLLLQLHYLEGGVTKYFDQGWKYHLKELILNIHRQVPSINFFVERGNRKYVTEGRNENESSALFIDKTIKNLLNVHNIDYTDVRHDETADRILKIIGEKIESIKDE